MKVQDHSILLRKGLNELLEAPLEELGQLVRSEAQSLTEAHLRVLDRLVSHVAVRALIRRDDDSGVEAARRGVARLLPPALEARWPRYADRWRAVADVLDARLEMRAARSEDEALSLKHANEIMEAIRHEPGVIQAKLGAALGLSPPNLSRILAVLESNELIERRRIGREKAIYPMKLDELARLRKQNQALRAENHALKAEAALKTSPPRQLGYVELWSREHAATTKVTENTAPTPRTAAKKPAFLKRIPREAHLNVEP